MLLDVIEPKACAVAAAPGLGAPLGLDPISLEHLTVDDGQLPRARWRRELTVLEFMAQSSDG